MFAFAKSDFQLRKSSFIDIEHDGYKCKSFFLALAFQLADFFLVQKQLTGAFDFMVEVTAETVFGDVEVIDPTFAAFYHAVCVAQVRLAFPQGFYLRASQNDPGSNCLQDRIFERSPLVLYLYLMSLFHCFCKGRNFFREQSVPIGTDVELRKHAPHRVHKKEKGHNQNGGRIFSYAVSENSFGVSFLQNNVWKKVVRVKEFCIFVQPF